MQSEPPLGKSQDVLTPATHITYSKSVSAAPTAILLSFIAEELVRGFGPCRLHINRLENKCICKHYFYFALFNNGSKQLDRKMTLWLLILDKMIPSPFFIPLAPDCAELRFFPSYLAVVLNDHKLRPCTASLKTTGGGNAYARKKKITFHTDMKERICHIEVIRPLGSWDLGAVMSLALCVFCSTVPCSVASTAHSYVNARTAPLHFHNSQSPKCLSQKEPTKTNSRK